MAYEITKEHVWVGAIPDKPGALAEKLRSLSDAGLDFELIISRREMPGRALLFISPLRSLEEIIAAEEAGLAQENSLRTIRITGPNVRGLGARITGALSQAGINMHGYSAAALGDQSVTNIAFDTEADADLAIAALEKELGT
jgi:hypothetical protein